MEIFLIYLRFIYKSLISSAGKCIRLDKNKVIL